jgi:hypothetical protein
MIVAYPIAGLGNRLMCITSSLYLAEIMQRDCSIIWRHDKDVPCDFIDLFKINKGLKLLDDTSVEELHEKIGEYENNIARRKENWQNKDFVLIKFAQLTFWENRVEAFTRIHGRFDTICINTWQGFGGHSKFFKHFIPVDEVATAVEKIDQKYELENRIGLHIRTTDHFKKKYHSHTDEYCPPEFFIDLIAKMIALDASTRFFIATDDESIVYRISSQFEGFVDYIPKKADRYSVEGAREALIDAYCLSRTKTVIGNYYSSFAHMAAKLGGKEVVRPQDLL